MTAFATPLVAQINPSHDWFTIRTPHFYVHFTRPVEPLARRFAGFAEHAYTELSKEMRPPRGMIDLVVTDDADRSNGSATPYPSNRIVVFANPPIFETGLRYTNDWGEMVITHELTHIFHLDRTRGIWSLTQKILGRAALSFPNQYQPSWITEGLAVYEETRIAGAGRVAGSEHRMIARATAIDDRFPAIGALSLAQGRYPFGSSAYVYGSLFIDYLAKTYGPQHVGEFVDKSAATLIPYFVDVPARQSFGVSFSRAYRDFRDSVKRSVGAAGPAPVEGWRDLTHEGVFASTPRWLTDSTVVYTGTPGRETFGAYRVGLDGRRTRIGRRNSRSPNVPFSDGTLLFSQLEVDDYYEERTDLWIQRGREEIRLTHGQRLTLPDARADGAIVAVQLIPGGTRLVRVSRDGRTVTPLTIGGPDEQWTEPRWSRAGDRIAAARWLRGNIGQIVVLDTVGRVIRTVSSGVSIEAAPSWLANDAGVMYSSDRTGSTQLYVERYADARTFAGAATFRLSDAATGMFDPSEAPRSARVAATIVRGDGFHLGVGACCESREGDRVADYRDSTPKRSAFPVVVDTSTARKYHAWRSLLPRYWLPTLDEGIRGGYRIGAMTSGIDVLGRHSFTAEAAYPTNDLGGIVGDVSYVYSGLGMPVLSIAAAQDWQSLGGISDRSAPQVVLGELFRRITAVDALVTWIRAGYRSSLALRVGPGLEYRTHVTTPDGLIPRIDTTGRFGSLTFPNLVGQASYSNVQFPLYAISPEDGVQLSLTVRDRLRSGVQATGGQSISGIGTAAVYKSLNLPGFAHHVLALRGTAGFADSKTATYFSVGGVSGSPFQVIPGYVLGEGRKTFPVRGFDAGSVFGTRAFAGSAEYRVPLWLIGNSPGVLPFFFDRSSLTLFGDFGAAWCGAVSAVTEVCNRAGQDRRVEIGSVGAEVNLNLGFFSWDSPYRFRLGVVHPTQNGTFFGQKSVQVYVVSGVSF
jgi:hypothetical protein